MNCEEAGFTKFQDLPFELRRQIWGEAMPAHGIYLVDCDAVLIDSNDDQEGHKTLHLTIRPAHHKFQADSLEQRVRTQKILLSTCAESRAELCRRFPDTLGGDGPRFSFRNDLIYIVSDILRRVFIKHKLPPEVRLGFEGGWNRLIHRLVLNCEMLQVMFRLVQMTPRQGNLQRDRYCYIINGFLELLATCTSLRQLVLTNLNGIGFDAWAEMPHDRQTTLSESMADCYGRLTCQASEKFDTRVGQLGAAALFLRQIIFDDLDATIDRSWLVKLETGYPVLRGLEILKMVHVSPELRWLCKDLRLSEPLL